MDRPPYPTNLTIDEEAIFTPLLPADSKSGRPRKWSLLEILNAIFYILRSGCAWRLLPHDFPPWQTVYYYFAKWKKDATWDRIHNTKFRRRKFKMEAIVQGGFYLVLGALLVILAISGIFNGWLPIGMGYKGIAHVYRKVNPIGFWLLFAGFSGFGYCLVILGIRIMLGNRAPTPWQ